MPGRRNDMTYVQIPCLKCRKKFQSNDRIKNRICNDCRIANSHFDAGEPAGISKRR